MAGSNTDVDQFIDALLGQGPELKHYGVKGMRWGTRSKQGSDGRVKRETSDDFKDAKVLAKKRPSQLSNAELKKLNERLQLEQNYKSLTTKKNQQTIKEGREHVKTTLELIKLGQQAYTVAKPGAKIVAELIKNR